MSRSIGWQDIPGHMIQTLALDAPYDLAQHPPNRDASCSARKTPGMSCRTEGPQLLTAEGYSRGPFRSGVL